MSKKGIVIDFSNLLNGVKSLFGVGNNKSIVNNVVQPSGGLITRNEQDWGMYGVEDYKISPIPWEAYSNPIVFRDLRLIGNALGNVTYQVQERDKDNPENWSDIVDHPFERIIENPNPLMTKNFAQDYQAVQMHLFGEAYCMMVPNKASKRQLFQMYPLPSSRMNPYFENGKMLYKYESVSGQPPAYLLPENFVRHRFSHPFGYYYGYSPLMSLIFDVKTIISMMRMDLDDILNSLNLHHIARVDRSVSDDDFRLILAKLNAGVVQGQRFNLVRADEMQIDPVSNPRDAKYTEVIRGLTQQDIDSALGVPTAIWDKNSIESNARAGIDLFITQTAWPLANKIAMDYTQAVRYWYDNDDLRVVPVDFRPEDKDFKLREKEFNLNLLTYNEARDIEGLPPHPNKFLGNCPASAVDNIVALLVQMGVDITKSDIELLTVSESQNGFTRVNESESNRDEMVGEAESSGESKGGLAALLYEGVVKPLSDLENVESVMKTNGCGV